MADIAASLSMELIAAAHAAVPHDAGVLLYLSLYNLLPAGRKTVCAVSFVNTIDSIHTLLQSLSSPRESFIVGDVISRSNPTLRASAACHDKNHGQ